MSSNQSETASETTFTWHPEYVGKSFESVQRELTDSIERDQRAYHLALDNAEKEEFGAFNSVRDLEKRWSEFDFGWAETPADQLAARIMAFEKTQEDRQELIGWQEWRSENSGSQPREISPAGEKRDWRENLTDQQRRKIASALSIGIILIMVLVCIGLYALIR